MPSTPRTRLDPQHAVTGKLVKKNATVSQWIDFDVLPARGALEAFHFPDDSAPRSRR